MASNDAIIQAEIEHKAAVLLLAKGRKLPDYLAEMDIRSRIIAVNAVDKIAKIPDLLFEILVTQPATLAGYLEREAILSSEMGGTLDRLASMARNIAANWSLEELRATYLNAGHVVADAVAQRTVPVDG